jgi:hypothetical protein
MSTTSGFLRAGPREEIHDEELFESMAVVRTELATNAMRHAAHPS